jgi:outer membrane protein assembly factor BamB
VQSKEIFRVVGLFIISFLIMKGCGKPTADHWSELIPGSTLFIIVPDHETSLEQMLAAPYIPWFDDISPAAFQLVSAVQRDIEVPIITEALLLYPDTSIDWQPVWITRRIDGITEKLSSQYQLEFEQNRYSFNRHTIEKLFMADRIMFIIDIGDYTVLSESSLAIENILRTISKQNPAIQLRADQIEAGSIIFNTPSLDIWIKQIAQVSYRPYLAGIFKGTSPVSFRFLNGENEPWQWQLRGELSLESDKSALVQYFSEEAGSYQLERYIPANASSFSLFRSDPLRVPVDDIEPVTDADVFLHNEGRYTRDLKQHLGNEAAFVSFANSGPASSSEFLYLRIVQNPNAIRSIFDELAASNIAVRDENTYFFNSLILGRLLGSELNPADNFYVTVYDRVIAIAQRKGLAESIVGDAERRRVMLFDDQYSRVRRSFTQPISALFYTDATRFSQYVQPWLYPQNYMGTLAGIIDQLTITTTLQPGGDKLDINITNFEREQTSRPFREHWVFPLGDADITGTPVLADITGSNRNEVIFSTENGTVYVLASDGTVVAQMETDNSIPAGSPVVYDWYGNNQNVIMQAAGNRVYAWNRTGELLPNFPVILNEEITTPLTIMDVTGNGVAEMIVATADRSIHILNSRGTAISGWPQNTNTVVSSRPLIRELNGQVSLFAFAENALHAWNINGQRRNGFPVFLPAQLNGSPVIYGRHLIGAGMDGSLYSVGTLPLFDDNLSSLHRSDSLYIQSVSVSNSSLNSTPVVHDLMLRGEDGLFREDLILVQSSNGSLYLYNEQGELRFAESMGQPGSSLFMPTINDINSDQRMDVITLSDFGRLYAWDVTSAERHLDLPTFSMRYPLISDFFRDGNKQVIAQTREGLQTWTINFTRRESSP